MSKLRTVLSETMTGRALAACALLVLAGCTSRGMTVTSEPAGAEVSINHHVVGVTPIRVGFTHYGTYSIELRKRGFDTLEKNEDIKPRIYGYDPVAFVADNAIPARLNDEVCLHYVLKPLQGTGERTALMDRAMAARTGSITDKNGKQVTIDLGREPSPLTGPEPATAAVTPPPAEPPAPDKVAADPNDSEKPKGLTLAKEYHIDVKPAEKAKPQFADPKADDKKAANAPLRIPKDEDLIYDQPTVTDPALKK